MAFAKWQSNSSSFIGPSPQIKTPYQVFLYIYGRTLIWTTGTVFPVGTNTLSGTQAHRKDDCTAEHSHRKHRTTGGTSNHRKTKRPHNRMNKPGKG